MARRWLDLGATALATVVVAAAGLALHTETPDGRPDQARSDVPSSFAPAGGRMTTPEEPASGSAGARVVDTDTVIGVRLDQTVAARSAHVDDLVTARVSRDVVVDSRTLIPAGTPFEGLVTLVERGERTRGRARIGIRFTALVLPDRTRVAIHTDTIFRDAGIDAGTPLTVKLTAPVSIPVKKENGQMEGRTLRSARNPRT